MAIEIDICTHLPGDAKSFTPLMEKWHLILTTCTLFEFMDIAFARQLANQHVEGNSRPPLRTRICVSLL